MRLAFLPYLLTASATPLRSGNIFDHSTENYHHERTLAKKDATVTKTFKFKDDFFLRFESLSSGISLEYSVELLDALDAYGEEFRDLWVEGLMADLPENCAVEEMSIPKFSICNWRYPDYYDVNELPVAGQSYIYEDTYVQRLYYQVESLKISCLNPEGDYPTYQDLAKDTYTADAFSTTSFRDILNPLTCTNINDCYWSNVTSVTYDNFSEDNANIYVQRFMDVEMYLKCVNREGYGPKIANVLIEAMDQYFELYVEPELTKEIMSHVPEGSVYNYASPYGDDVDRVFFTHGAYYTGGDIIDQIRADDGDLVTKYEYGFDVVWFWPKDATDDIIPNVPSTVNPIYQNNSFLTFLQQEFSQYGWVQRLDFCEPVDTMPDYPQLTFVPTPAPTEKPTQLSEIGESCSSDFQCEDGLKCHFGSKTCVCNMETGYGCTDGNVCEVYEKDLIPRCYCNMFDDEGPNGCEAGQYCRFSCKFTSDNPRCFDDEFVRDCGTYGNGYTCADANNDGVIDVNDKSGGCDYNAPTMAPQTLPTLIETPAPTIVIPAITPAPSMTIPTSIPTLFPTIYEEIITCDSNSTNTCPDGMCCIEDQCVKCICHPVEKPKPVVGTCGNGDRGDGICAWEGYCCSEWGWCGTTPEYCDGPSNAPTPSGFYPPPTPSLDAGKCGFGAEGEGLCADPDHCCSQWGYCGPGEGYCYVVDDGTNTDGTCGGGGVGNGVCGSGHCCSEYGYCGEGPEYCTGYVDKGEITPDEELVIERSPLPENLLPVFGFRCGVTEVDARSNCKKECTHHIQCNFGEECWGVQLNYCNTFEEGTHPVCTDIDKGNTDSRCGYDEVSARGHCGPKCNSDSDCGEQQYCFPTILNLCDCFEEMGSGSLDPVFSEAEDGIKPYFLGELVVAEKPVAVEGDGEVEGIPRSSSNRIVVVGASLFVSLLAAFAMY